VPNERPPSGPLLWILLPIAAIVALGLYMGTERLGYVIGSLGGYTVPIVVLIVIFLGVLWASRRRG
jgi:hypothetical protein